MSELLSRVQALAEKRASESATTYQDLVRATAEGDGQLDEGEVVELLDRLGKSPSQLAADVSAHRRRCELQALADGVPALNAARLDRERRIAELVRQRDAEVAKFNMQIRTLEAESSELIQRIQEGDQAKNTLAAERAKRR